MTSTNLTSTIITELRLSTKAYRNSASSMCTGLCPECFLSFTRTTKFAIDIWKYDQSTAFFVKIMPQNHTWKSSVTFLYKHFHFVKIYLCHILLQITMFVYHIAPDFFGLTFKFRQVSRFHIFIHVPKQICVSFLGSHIGFNTRPRSRQWFIPQTVSQNTGGSLRM